LNSAFLIKNNNKEVSYSVERLSHDRKNRIYSGIVKAPNGDEYNFQYRYMILDMSGLIFDLEMTCPKKRKVFYKIHFIDFIYDTPN
jgi:hypothetical protein